MPIAVAHRHIAALCLVVGLLAGSYVLFHPLGRASTSATRSDCGNVGAATVVTQTNTYRDSLGLSRLRVVPKLHAFALVHAREMAASHRLTHFSTAGLSFAQRARASTYRFSMLRENIAVDASSSHGSLASSLMRLWKRSPGHDANMRARDVSQIGVGLAAGTHGCYASMDLGSPR